MVQPLAIIVVSDEAKYAVALAAVFVPVLYAVATKFLDFYIKWELKGRKSRGTYRIWIEEDDNLDLELRTGEIEKVATLHGDGRKIAHLEQSVRFRHGNPYSLGLDLTVGAIVVDLASQIGGEGYTQYLGWALILHILLLFGNFGLLVSNQQASPDKVWRMRATAALAIVLGLTAMGTSFLALDANLVDSILNASGNR